MRLLAAPTMLTVTITLALAGCGGSGGASVSSKPPAASAVGSATTDGAASAASTAGLSPDRAAARAFAAHAGVAFGTFYRFIYAPYTKGAFNPSRPDRRALATARAAAAVVSHEIDMATRAAQGSAALVRLRAPMRTLDEGFKIALVKLRAGHFKLAEIQTANIAISAIKGSASSAGLPIGERPASV